MDAIKLLKQQHRLVEKLFSQFEKADDEDEQRRIFLEIADNLAVHATIEERHFYPAVRARDTERLVEEAYEEHLEVKQLTLDGMKAMETPAFESRATALQEAVEHHVEEEEEELFPKVQKLMGKDALEAIGQMMEAEAAELMNAGEPRNTIKVETEPPAMQT